MTYYQNKFTCADVIQIKLTRSNSSEMEKTSSPVDGYRNKCERRDRDRRGIVWKRLGTKYDDNDESSRNYRRDKERVRRDRDDSEEHDDDQEPTSASKYRNKFKKYSIDDDYKKPRENKSSNSFSRTGSSYRSVKDCAFKEIRNKSSNNDGNQTIRKLSDRTPESDSEEERTNRPSTSGSGSHFRTVKDYSYTERRMMNSYHEGNQTLRKLPDWTPESGNEEEKTEEELEMLNKLGFCSWGRKTRFKYE